MADSAPETDFVKKPAYPDITAKPKVTKPPASAGNIAKAARRPKPASVAQLGAKKKPLDPMEVARMSKIGQTIAGMMGK